MFFRGREVAVVGGGSTALQDAEFLSNYCSKVYLIHRRDEFRGEDQIVKRLQEKENVEFILNTTVQEICGEQMVESLRVLNKVTGEESELAVSGMVISCLNRSPSSRQLKKYKFFLPVEIICWQFYAACK